MGSKLVPQIILEGTRLRFKTGIGFALNEHPRRRSPKGASSARAHQLRTYGWDCDFSWLEQRLLPRSSRLVFLKRTPELFAAEELQTITSQATNLLNVGEEGTCTYEDASGNPLITVIVTKGAGQDCTVVGSDAETLPNLGDMAAWGPTSKTACVVKGDTRAQIVMGSALPAGVDLRTAAIALLTVAAGRLP
jgi:hypothetical protein